MHRGEHPCRSRHLLLTLLFGAAVITLAIHVALTRGPWLDEFWSMWLGDPLIPLGDALWSRWLADVHPPLFSGLSRLAQTVLGASLPTLRLTNLIPLTGFLAAALLVAVRLPQTRAFLSLYVIITISNPQLLDSFSDFRSYLAQHMFGGIFALGCLLWHQPSSEQGAGRAAGLAMLLASILFLVSCHYISAVYCTIAVAVLCLVALRERRFRDVLILMAATAAALAPVLCFLAAQAGFLASYTGGRFWLSSPTSTAMLVTARVLLRSAGLNLVVLAAAALGALAVVRGWMAKPATTRDGCQDAVMAASAVLAVSVIVLFGAGFLINIHTPIFLERYFSAAMGSISFVAAALSYRLIAARGSLHLAVLGCAMLAVGTTYARADLQRWSATAEVVAREVTACPGAPVYALVRRPRPLGRQPMPGHDAVLALGYRYVADAHGFRVRIIDAGARPGEDTPAACPTIVWSEHVMRDTLARLRSPADLVRETGLRLLPAELAGARLEHGTTGVVLIVPATAP